MKTKKHRFRINDALWFEGDSNYTNIYYIDGTQFLSGYTISFFEKILSEQKEFVRVHKSVIVNRAFLDKFEENGRNGYVTLTNGKTFGVARRRKQVVLDAMQVV